METPLERTLGPSCDVIHFHSQNPRSTQNVGKSVCSEAGGTTQICDPNEPSLVCLFQRARPLTACSTSKYRQAYLFPGEYMPGQFDHSKVSTTQRLVQVVQPSNLPIVMTFEPCHGCQRTWRGELPSVACQLSVFHLLVNELKLDEAISDCPWISVR